LSLIIITKLYSHTLSDYIKLKWQPVVNNAILHNKALVFML